MMALMSSDRIRLRNYRLTPRKARIELVGDAAVLVLPGYFGRRRWGVKLSDLAVVDLTAPNLAADVEEDVFRDDLTIPYFFTTGPVTAPTTLLLFDTPQRVPPLRISAAWVPNMDLPFGYRESRSERGALLDGALLRAEDPSSAADRLVLAGARRVHDPAGWLRANRDVVTDPVEREQILAHGQRSVWLARASNGLVFASLIGASALNTREDVAAVLLSFPVLGVGVGLLLRRMAKQPPPPTRS